MTASWTHGERLTVNGAPAALVPWLLDAAAARDTHQVISSTQPNPPSAARMALAALLMLEHGELRVDDAIHLRGAIKLKATRDALEHLLTALPDVSLDLDALDADEGRATGPLLTLTGAPAAMGEAGRVRAGAYRSLAGALVFVRSGATTKVVDDAPSIMIDGEQVALDDNVQLVRFDEPDGLD